MDTATIEISGLPQIIIEKLGKRAEKIGATTPEYVRYLIEDDLISPMSLRVLYAPVREQIRAENIPDDELDALLDEAREGAFQERSGRKAE